MWECVSSYACVCLCALCGAVQSGEVKDHPGSVLLDMARLYRVIQGWSLAVVKVVGLAV